MTRESTLPRRYREWIAGFARSARQGYFRGSAGKRLFFRIHRQADCASEAGAVIVINGRTETCLKYEELAFDLYRNRFSIYTYDHRGQGLSDRVLSGDPQKGHVERFDRYVEDLERFVAQVVETRRHRRCFLLGHSMGGCIASLFLEKRPQGVHAAVLMSPMHAPGAFPEGMQRWVCAAAQRAPAAIATRYVPGTGPYDVIGYPFAENPLTQSRERYDHLLHLYRKNPAVQMGGPTIHWLAEACRWSERARECAGTIQVPVLLLQAGADTVVSPEAQRRFVEVMSSESAAACTAFCLPGARHELLIEADRYRIPAVSVMLDFFTGEIGI
ncbi:MAG: alpha/beta fold hydrolase [Desulfobacteraceae bacterium]|nr:alpha/beta fold hydrolase [Desulfobacteraceae bacterium]